MNRSTWIIIAGIVTSINLLMMTGTAIASNDVSGSTINELKQVYTHEDNRAPANKGYLFDFSAEKVCHQKFGLRYCAKVWGSGHFTPDRDSITGRGGYEVILDGERVGMGTWTAVDLVSGSASEVTFVARYVKGDIGAILKESSTGNPAKLCLYGKIINIPDPKDSICSK
ncbi:MAG: hypothetical protein ACRD38_09715, partial [Nitrososphaerales archaeon]